MKILKKSFLIMFIFMLVGCSKEKNNEDYVSIQDMLINMDSYSANVNVTYYSNKGENSYSISQDAKNDGKYYIKTNAPEHLKGNILLYDGKLLWQYNPSLDKKISIGEKDKMARKELCIFSFLENHLKSKDIALETSNIDDNIYTILEAKIPGDDKYFSTEKLYINNKTKAPEKLIIYDKEGKERVIAQYDSFVYNPKLEDSKFDIESITNSQEN